MDELTRQPSLREIEEERNIQTFKEEAYERLSELEDALLDLEKSPEDQALIDQAFRAMHTIKGSGGMFGFDDIVKFTHNIETVFEKVRDRSISLDSELIALSLLAHDQIGKMLEHFEDSNPENIRKREEITLAFKRILDLSEGPVDDKDNQFSDDLSLENSKTSIYRIRFKPLQELFSTGTNPLLLLNEIRELGDCQVISHLSKIPSLSEIDPETCYIWWDIILNTSQKKSAINDVFIFVQDLSEITIELIDSDTSLDSNEEYKRLGEILVDRGDIGPNDLHTVLSEQKRLGEELERKGLVGQTQIKSALAEQSIVKNIREKRRKIDISTSIRVSSYKLDQLIDLIGELVTAQARLSQIATTNADASVLSVAEEIKRLTTELRDSTMSVRMLSFGTTFNKFKRLVRDLSVELKKEIILITDGSETELDKNIMELLNDPLVHLLRNSIDHGIESPAARKKKGKAETGTIKLSASYSGAHVLIKIEDDGAGMDPAKIREKAISKGLIVKENRLSDKDCFFLVFEPGFSTAATVTNVSGRGVGMDVVKKAIEDLRGSVDIDSTVDQGTSITLKLPLTLAIIDGLLVAVEDEVFVIPLAAVEECIELTQEELEENHGRHLTKVRDEFVPYVRLRDQFKIDGKTPAIEQIVITEIDGHRIGFVVDDVIGQHQTVIKNLSKIYKGIETISGATIMADGTVALIIDINKYLHIIETKALEKYQTTNS